MRTAWTTSHIDNPASWIVREKTTGAVVCETFSAAAARKVNTDKYEVVPIILYLAELDRPAS